MLLIKSKRDDLLAPLQSVSGIVEKRHTLPILSNVLIEKRDRALTLLATDIEVQIRTTAPASEGEATAVTVGARKLQDILRSLPESERGEPDCWRTNACRCAPERAASTCRRCRRPTIRAWRTAEGEHIDLQIGSASSSRLFALVQYAMAQQDIRYYLNGLLLVVTGSEARRLSPPTATVWRWRAWTSAAPTHAPMSSCRARP